MKNIKKLGISLVLLCLFIITGCGTSSQKNGQTFDEYIDTLPTRFYDNDDFNLEFLFKDPTAYGFQEELLTLPYTDESGYDEAINEAKQVLSELESFSYEELNDDQKLTYDILTDNIERSFATSDFYDLDNSYLGSFVSFQAQLPMLLNEYTFERQHDLDSYFNILSTSEETFEKYFELEKSYQEKGTGMTKTILDKTIEQCENFSNTDRLFLIDEINKRIDATDFLNEDEKIAAKTKNEDLLMNHLRVAYETLGTNLSTLTPNDEDFGLASKPNGKEYYEALLKQNTGLDMDIEDVRSYLTQKDKEITLDFLNYLSKDKDLLETADFSSLTYSDFTSVKETLDYLGTRIFEDFPKVDQLNYSINTVDESMKDNFSPAAYLQSKIDAGIEEDEVIYINGDYKQNLFPTIAHEGYPGHMYQNVYFKSKNLPTIRYMLSYNGYSEGWATYVEKLATQYAPVEDKKMLELYDLNQELVKVSYCFFDIGINYDGWDRTQFKSEIKKLYGNSLDDDVINNQYDIFIETPTNYLQYYLNGFKFDDLRTYTENKLGDDFDAVEFHDVILSTGPAPYSILQEQVDKYIMTKE